MTVVSLDMAYRSFRGGSGRLRHPPRYAAFNQTSSPRFRLSSLISGIIDYQCAVVAVVLSQIDGKTIKPLVLLAPERSPYLPNIASSSEQGLGRFDAATWNALFLPKGTPPAIVQKLNTATVAAMQTPAVRDRLRSIGAEPPTGERATVEYMVKTVEEDQIKWAEPIRAAKISAD
ncbi:MAG: tripartite tricarboxylate transporter substrate-binding protein [Alphaproteobacteria bacterium]|nr:tripartite tricarboxylate transporter substrate-binding protein [Alphaproteobacteria bacterium]